MPPRKNAFETETQQFNALVESQPVDRAMVFDLVADLEERGSSLIGDGKLQAAPFAEAMHKVYGRMIDLETVPPQTQKQKKLVAGKYATYAAMVEATTPKKTAKPGPTDTNKVETDQPKS